jgi:hypothetical protein
VNCGDLVVGLVLAVVSFSSSLFSTSNKYNSGAYDWKKKRLNDGMIVL